MYINAMSIVLKCAEFCQFFANFANIYFVECLLIKSRENQFFSAPENFPKMRLGFSCQWHSLVLRSGPLKIALISVAAKIPW